MKTLGFILFWIGLWIAGSILGPLIFVAIAMVLRYLLDQATAPIDPWP